MQPATLHEQQGVFPSYASDIYGDEMGAPSSGASLGGTVPVLSTQSSQFDVPHVLDASWWKVQLQSTPSSGSWSVYDGCHEHTQYSSLLPCTETSPRVVQQPEFSLAANEFVNSNTPKRGNGKVSGNAEEIQNFVETSTKEDQICRLLYLENVVLKKKASHHTEKNILLQALAKSKSKINVLTSLVQPELLPTWACKYGGGSSHMYKKAYSPQNNK